MENESGGMRLLKNSKKGIHRIIFSRMGIVLLLLLLNMGILAAFFLWCEEFLPHIYGGTALFTIFMMLYLINSPMDATSKTTWLILIMLTPVFGSLFYLFTKKDLGRSTMCKRILQIQSETKGLIRDNEEARTALAQRDPGAEALTRFVSRYSPTTVYADTDVRYFPVGEDKFRQLLLELEKAEKFIFLEYFIIDEGVMWGKILQILAKKAAQGVDVRVMYDGTCEFLLLPKGYPKKLKALGIQCKVFSPATPFLSTHYNYRDHRKILVIDGHTAFTGGVNLSDEYINIGSRFGHWKDTAIMLKGEAVKSFTMLFLQAWNLDQKAGEYLPFLDTAVPEQSAKGYVVPYGDSPLDDVRVGQQVYMDILARARRYVHIMTPYLILDQEMENTLKYAAARGVDVKLMLPGIPDKKTVYSLAKTHYKSLMESGVKIYEYSPGFVHAKVFVCDDREAVVGTINLDYRSLYHHFECGAYMHSTGCIEDIESDFQHCLTKCRVVTYETIKKEKWYLKVMGFVLKVFAPLM